MKTTDKNREKDNFSRMIRNKLTDYSLPIEESSWEELENRLNAPSRKKILLWPWVSRISIAASIAGAILFSYYHTKESHYDNTAQLSHHEERIAENVSEEKNLSPAGLPSIQTQPERRLNHRETPDPGKFALHEPDVVSATEPIEKNEKLSGNEENSVSQTRTIHPDYPLKAIREQEYIPVSIVKRKTKSIALHISSGGRLYAANNHTLNTAAFNGAYSELRYSNISKNAPSSLSSDMLSSDDFNQITHRPPMAVGLSIQKTLTDYLSVESGLTYTYLYSTFENKVPRREASLSLHYLGIPVNLVAHLHPYSRHSWNIYFSAGGMVEKGLLSHYVQNIYSTESSVAVITTSNESIDGLQWSIQAAIGLSYRFHRGYSIYIEPKVSYYLENNQPFNVRTEHPFVPGINVGLRHTW
ncbi:MAG: autotransporter outer membrane beta-barrel domain-containing protein [Dysgonamonadaceae bacterium]|jgi:hypothetical protein|nr:autotransporter outer membrane beta-barrel domain-containing protein [Dysgonamonadaceae bacterium]